MWTKPSIMNNYFRLIQTKRINLKHLDFFFKNFNENVRNKFDIMNKMSVNRNLTDLNWYCREVNIIKILQKLLQLCVLDQTSGLQGFLDFYDSKDRLLTLLKTSSSPKSTKTYFIQLISLLNKLFRLSVTSTYWMMKTMAHKQTIVICI